MVDDGDRTGARREHGRTFDDPQAGLEAFTAGGEAG